LLIAEEDHIGLDIYNSRRTVCPLVLGALAGSAGSGRFAKARLLSDVSGSAAGSVIFLLLKPHPYVSKLRLVVILT